MKKNELVYPIYGRVREIKNSISVLYYVGYQIKDQIWVIDFNDGKVRNALGKFFRLHRWNRKILSMKKIKKTGRVIGKLQIENVNEVCINIPKLLPPVSFDFLINMEEDIKYNKKKYIFKLL